MNISDKSFDKILTSQKLLKLTYGLLFIAAGADKFLNLITNWQKYVSSFVLKNSPLQSTMIVILIGIIEIFTGFIILMPKYTKIGAYLASLLLVIFALNLLNFRIYYDIAIRDIVMAIGAIALAILTKVIEESQNAGAGEKNA